MGNVEGPDGDRAAPVLGRGKLESQNRNDGKWRLYPELPTIHSAKLTINPASFSDNFMLHLQHEIVRCLTNQRRVHDPGGFIPAWPTLGARGSPAGGRLAD